MHYKFMVTERLCRTVDVDASCYKDALCALDEAIDNEDVVLTADDFSDRDFTLVANSPKRFDECENFVKSGDDEVS